MIFFDFKAAFPSVSQQFLINSMRLLGLPEHAISLTQALYDQNNCKVSFGGETYEGFGMHRGVRQGCPISPLLFAVSVDILLRMLHKRVPSGVFRAFADDIGAVITDFPSQSQALQQVFQRVSGNLRLRT